MASDTFWRLIERLRSDPELRKQVRARPLAFLKEYDLADDERIEIIVPNFRWQIAGRLAGVSRPHSDDALATLRSLGLRELLLSADGGYCLNPNVPMFVSDEPHGVQAFRETGERFN